jgi:phosphosulfolactate synthase (CoM biosynthesis protein A)
MTAFLDLPDRSTKPRERGITHVIDRGLSVAEVDGLVEVAGASVDVVKLGWERRSPPQTSRPSWSATAPTTFPSCWAER